MRERFRTRPAACQRTSRWPQAEGNRPAQGGRRSRAQRELLQAARPPRQAAAVAAEAAAQGPSARREGAAGFDEGRAGALRRAGAHRAGAVRRSGGVFDQQHLRRGGRRQRRHHLDVRVGRGDAARPGANPGTGDPSSRWGSPQVCCSNSSSRSTRVPRRTARCGGATTRASACARSSGKPVGSIVPRHAPPGRDDVPRRGRRRREARVHGTPQHGDGDDRPRRLEPRVRADHDADAHPAHHPREHEDRRVRPRAEHHQRLDLQPRPRRLRAAGGGAAGRREHARTGRPAVPRHHRQGDHGSTASARPRGTTRRTPARAWSSPPRRTRGR